MSCFVSFKKFQVLEPIQLKKPLNVSNFLLLTDLLHNVVEKELSKVTMKSDSVKTMTEFRKDFSFSKKTCDEKCFFLMDIFIDFC